LPLVKSFIDTSMYYIDAYLEKHFYMYIYVYNYVGWVMNGRARRRSRAVVFLVRGLDWADDRHRTSARCSVEEETNADLSAVYGAHDCTTALLSENCNL